jgi:triacylglycerol lipase
MKNNKDLLVNGIRCKTKYPVIFIHGAGFRDDSSLYNYWGRISETLIRNGAEIFYSGHDAWSNIEKSAVDIKPKVIEVISLTGAKKVNLIAHSKGGLDARYMITALNMSRYVASLTTLSTPHHGSKTIDLLFKLPVFLFKTAAFFVNVFFKLLGDKKPDFFHACRQFTTEYCKIFNAACPDTPDIYYRSYGAKMKNPFSDLLFFITHAVIKLIEGDNDGICSVESSKWGDTKEALCGKHLRGVSHADLVDLRRINNRSFDILETYMRMLEDLKDMGL